MSAIDDARAALAAFDRAGVDTVLTKVPAVVAALRSLIEPPDAPEDWEYGVAWRWNDMICGYPEVDEASARAGAQRSNDLADDEDDTEFFAARRFPQHAAGPWLPVAEDEP